MRNKILFLSLSLLFFACSVPEGVRESGEEAIIFPDYKGVVIPPNISPLDFKDHLRGKCRYHYCSRT